MQGYLPYQNPFIKKLLSHVEKGPDKCSQDDQLAEKIIRKWVNKFLKRNIERGGFGSAQDLENALISKDPNSCCVTLPKDAMKTHQMQRKVLLHELACRFWRWPDMKTHLELKPARNCQYSWPRGKDEVCINPYHYRRESSHNPTIYVPKTIEGATVRESSLGSDSLGPVFPLPLGEKLDCEGNWPPTVDLGFLNCELMSEDNFSPTFSDWSSLTSASPHNLPADSPDFNQRPQLDFNRPLTDEFLTSPSAPQSSLSSSDFAPVPSRTTYLDISNNKVGNNVADDAVFGGETKAYQGQPSGQMQTDAEAGQYGQGVNMHYGGYEVEQAWPRAQVMGQPAAMAPHPFSGAQPQSRAVAPVAADQVVARSPVQRQTSPASHNAAMPVAPYGNNLPVQQPQLQASPKSRQELVAVEYVDGKHWCTIYYYEMENRIGEAFYANTNRIVVDGYTSQNDDSRFCLGALSNVQRDKRIEMTRKSIGSGILLWNVNGEIFIENVSESPVFVQAPNCNHRYKWHPATVCKIPPHCTLKLFANPEFAMILAQSVHLGFESVYSLTRMCIVRVSFVKGWGENYKRQSITETHCWIEIQLNGPLQWLDKILQQIGSPRYACSSMS